MALERILNKQISEKDMKFVLFNTLTKKKEMLKPLVPGHIGMYTCGPTVYGHLHLGHIRTAVAYDVLKEYLKNYFGLTITHIQNITDVGHIVGDVDEGEDKIVKEAKNRQMHPMELVDSCIEEMWAGFDALKCSRPNIAPRATGHIVEMQDWCIDLIKKGFAYEVDGSVYFDVSKSKGYGSLSGNKPQELKEGARIEVNDKKRNSRDFALWKKAEQNHILQWTSPWGKGYPGWHIECSVMSTRYLGPTIDIHGGARELSFPHHENEIAQSEAYTGKKFVNHWVHTGLLLLNGEKMAKSTGNYLTVSDALKIYSPEDIRWFILSNHYSSTINFSKDLIEGTRSGLGRINNFLFSLGNAKPASVKNKSLVARVNRFAKDFETAMNDDMNTPRALSEIYSLVNYINPEITLETIDKDTRQTILDKFKKINKVFKTFKLDDYSKSDSASVNNIQDLIEKRAKAKKDKNWQEADRIRQELQTKGIELMDQKDGTTLWKEA
jgi:cysteinyl-tRNA synthetase